MLKRILTVVAALGLLASSAFAADSVLDKVLKKGTIVIGTAPGYFPFEMKDKKGEFIGYDIDLGRAIAASLGVKVEFRQFKFAGLIPALQTGDIDMLIAGMTIRGDRAKAVSFSNPYYLTGQCLMVPKSDTASKKWQDVDVKGKKIGVSQGKTSALLAKQIIKNASISEFQNFPDTASAMVLGQIDAVIYDQPAILKFEAMHPDKVRGVYDLISNEGLGIAVQLNDLNFVQWTNSFLYGYIDSPEERKSRAKWFSKESLLDM